MLIIKDQWKEHSILNIFGYHTHCRDHKNLIQIVSKPGDNKKENMWYMWNTYNYRHKYYYKLGEIKDKSWNSTPLNFRSLIPYWTQVDNQAATPNTTGTSLKKECKFDVSVYVDIGSLIIKNGLEEKSNFFFTKWEMKARDIISSILSD